MAERLAYWRAVLGAVPIATIARAAARRLVDPPRYHRPRPASGVDIARATAALAARPRLFPVESRDLRRLYREALPGAIDRARARAESILRREVDVFGEVVSCGSPVGLGLPWHRDLLGGGEFPSEMAAESFDLRRWGPDPRGAWELARASHLVELGVAARLDPSLRDACTAEVHAQITDFLDANPVGVGVHWTSPIEVGLRVVHWLAALELVDERSPAFLRRLGAALVEHGRFLAGNLEDRGLVPANHLIADRLGLLAIGVALDDAAEAPEWRREAASAIAREARVQVHPDGAAFEASTPYHRFTLELLLAADRLARAAGLPLDLDATLARMFRFVAGYVGPDGSEPCFGDADDGRVLPMAPRSPREHAYLLALGAVRTGDPTLRRAGVEFSEEAAWEGGRDGWLRWCAITPQPAPAIASFVDGGVHVLRAGDAQVALRAGGYGQRGVGGHAHNDQLAVTVWLGGAPLVVDPGTACYTADPAWREHLRGTAAHATVAVEGEEQSQIHEGRLFALPDMARGRCLAVDEAGDRLRILAEHRGYRRLPARATHRREVLLDRASGALLVCDAIRAAAPITATVSFPLGDAYAHPADAAAVEKTRDRLPPAWRGAIADGGVVVVERSGAPAAALVALDGDALAIEAGWWAPRYGRRARSTVVRLVRRSAPPVRTRVAMLLLDTRGESGT